MRCSRWALLIFLLLLAEGAFADSVQTFTITDVNMFFSISGDPEDMGDNFSFSGPGITMYGGGTLVCPGGWCAEFTPLPDRYPIAVGGLTLNFVDRIQIQGKTYDASSVEFSGPLFFTTSDPMYVPSANTNAVLNNGFILGQIGTGDNAFKFRLKIPPGGSALDFYSRLTLRRRGNSIVEVSLQKLLSPNPVPWD